MSRPGPRSRPCISNSWWVLLWLCTACSDHKISAPQANTLQDAVVADVGDTAGSDGAPGDSQAGAQEVADAPTPLPDVEPSATALEIDGDVAQADEVAGDDAEPGCGLDCPADGSGDNGQQGDCSVQADSDVVLLDVAVLDVVLQDGVVSEVLDVTQTTTTDTTTAGDSVEVAPDVSQTTADAVGPADNVLYPLPPQPVDPLLDITVELYPPGGSSVRDCLLAGRLDSDSTDDFLYVTRGKNGVVQIRVTRLGVGGLSSKPVVSTVPFLQSLEVYGCTLLDWDDDGDDDLMLAGNPWAELFLNNGKGGFAVVPDALPDLPTSSMARYGPMSVVDFDGDGWLDVLFSSLATLIPCTGVTCQALPDDFQCQIKEPPTENPAPDRLTVRDPVVGLQDATVAFGLPITLSQSRPLATDLDGDLLPDLLQTSDFGPTYALRNDQGNGFVPWPSSGLPSWGHAMGWGQGDLDRDGDLDYVLSDTGPNSVLFRVGNGPPLPGSPLAFVSLDSKHPLQLANLNNSTWSPMVEDWNGDGLLDIYFGVTMTWQPSQANLLGSCTLAPSSLPNSDVLALAIGTQPMEHGSWVVQTAPQMPCGDWGQLAQAAVDVDGDNDLDIVQARVGCKTGQNILRVLRNDLVQVGPTVRIRLQGPPHNRSAIGAEIVGMAGPHLQLRVLHGQMGSGSQSTLVQYIGLGQATALTGVQVVWPDGKVSQVGTLQPGYHEIAYLP